VKFDLTLKASVSIYSAYNKTAPIDMEQALEIVNTAFPMILEYAAEYEFSNEGKLFIDKFYVEYSLSKGVGLSE